MRSYTVACYSQGSVMHSFVRSLSQDFPAIQFCHGKNFCWSPKEQTITYPDRALNDDTDVWALLHETAHSILGHQDYTTDLQLLMMEVAAWDEAKKQADTRGITIDEEHIQDCLDTYRDWLHRRSTCPTCGVVGLQRAAKEYSCHNCPTIWHVSAARFCRPYRLKVSG